MKNINVKQLIYDNNFFVYKINVTYIWIELYILYILYTVFIWQYNTSKDPGTTIIFVLFSGNEDT